MNEPILSNVKQRVLTLTLNRPEKRNALSAEFVAALMQRLDEADRSPEVGAFVITGAGDKAFCAGGDLSGAGGDVVVTPP